MAEVTLTRTCDVDGCDRRSYSRGWCSMHYQRWRQHGDPGTVSSHHRTGSRDGECLACSTPLDRRPRTGGRMCCRVSSHVEVGGDGACWIWRGRRDHHGYGTLDVGTTTARAHRMVYELLIGHIPDGFVLLHACDNPPCVNPAHLSPGEQAANVADAIAKGRSVSPPVLRGPAAPHSKLTPADVVEMRRLHRRGVGVTELARRFGVARGTAHGAIVGRTWGHVDG